VDEHSVLKENNGQWHSGILGEIADLLISQRYNVNVGTTRTTYYEVDTHDENGTYTGTEWKPSVGNTYWSLLSNVPVLTDK